MESFDAIPPNPHSTAWQVYAEEGIGQVDFAPTPNPRPGGQGSSLRLRYAFPADAAGTAGLRILLPEFDASAYDHVTLWIRGDREAGYGDALRVEFRRPDPDTPRMLERGSLVIDGIGDDWRQIDIPLNFMTGLREWTRLSEFVVTLQSRRSPVKQGAYYIDDIVLRKTGRSGPSVRDPVSTPLKQAWENAHGGRDAAKSAARARLNGWPRSASIDPRDLPTDEQAFPRRVARDTWQGLVALSDREHGLPLDTVRFGAGSIDLADARIGDYTNVTNIGLFMIAAVAARELKLLSEDDATVLLGRVLATLESLETHRGFFFNYYDTTTLERTSHFVSFVDSAWLSAGLMVTRMAFPALHARCTALIERGDYRFFYDPVERHMHHGYYVNLPAYAEYRYGALYTEARIGSLIAIGKGEAPVEHWFSLARSFPPDYAWQSQMPRARLAKTVQGQALRGGYYEWRGLRYVPSWGGSLFEALMPTLVLDEQAVAPASLGRNNQVHTLVQQRFARDELGYPAWGLSPSSTPAGDGYAEYGVGVLGSRGYRAGAVTPHAAALALVVAPEAALANLRELAARYPLYGEYGFYDAVDPTNGQVARNYLALNQSMLFIALANHLCDHCVQRYFAADPIIQRVLPMLRDERFFDE